MLRHPPKWHALQIAEKQRRITDGRQAAADIGDDENKKNDVMRRDAILVHPDPGPDQEHRRAGCPQKICEHRADEQKNHIGQRCRLALDVDVNAAGDDKQRADQQDEADVVFRDMPHPARRSQDQKVIAERDGAESERNLGVMPQPPFLHK